MLLNACLEGRLPVPFSPCLGGRLTCVLQLPPGGRLTYAVQETQVEGSVAVRCHGTVKVWPVVI